jgi:hypothetical protein
VGVIEVAPTAALCSLGIAVPCARLKTRLSANDISSALIERGKEYGMRNNMMKLDMLSPELNRQFSGEFHAVQNELGNSLFNFDCFRKLTRQYVGKEEDANSLCELLRVAEESEARGDFAAKARFLRSYIDEISAQTRQPLICGSMTVLITLARTV